MYCKNTNGTAHASEKTFGGWHDGERRFHNDILDVGYLIMFVARCKESFPDGFLHNSSCRSLRRGHTFGICRLP